MPNDARIREQLLAACDSAELVEVIREITDAESVEGYVLGVGQQWLLMASLNWDPVLVDRYIGPRVADIREVNAVENWEFPRRAMQQCGLWPPARPAERLNLDDTHALLAWVAGQTPLVNIEVENDAADECYIGVVEQLT